MTTLSFEATDAEAQALEAWAGALHVDPAELLRDALRRQLAWLVGAADAARAPVEPAPVLSPPEESAADWGSDEDWSDWADAAR